MLCKQQKREPTTPAILTRAKEKSRNNKEYFNQMIIGLILGDGTLVRRKRKYIFSIYTNSYSLYSHIFNIFVNSNYCNITKEIIVKGIV